MVLSRINYSNPNYMGRTIYIASSDPLTRAELAEQLVLAGHQTASDSDQAALVLTDSANVLIAGNLPFPKPLRLEALLAYIDTYATELPVGHNWTLKPQERVLIHEDCRVHLTDKETALLQALLTAADHTCNRNHLLTEVWGYDASLTTHTLETHIHRLRSKLKEALGMECIETTEIGYRLVL